MIFIPAENNSEADFSLPLHEVFRLAAARREQMDSEIDTKHRVDVPAQPLQKNQRLEK